MEPIYTEDIHNMTLNKNDIIAAIAERKREVATLAVPEWGGEVNIRRLTAGDLESTGMLSGEQSQEIMLHVLGASLCDDEGDRLFEDHELRELHDADAVVTMRLFTECARINGLLSGELEEMVAGFGEAQLDDSSSD